jgi:hypothetical protein
MDRGWVGLGWVRLVSCFLVADIHMRLNELQHVIVVMHSIHVRKALTATDQTRTDSWRPPVTT